MRPMKPGRPTTTGRKPGKATSKKRSHFELAVFGVVNSGKTSLIRALLMQPAFGEVGITPGSTKAVDRAYKIFGKERARFTITDTPGVEGFYSIVSDFKTAAEDLEERTWLERFESWWRSRLERLGPVDPSAPTVEHRFDDAFKAMQEADCLCLVQKGSDLLQENVREDVAALLEIVRRLKKPIFTVLKHADSNAFADHRRSWLEFSQSLGIQQIATFDSHRRRRIHARTFFTSLAAALPATRRRDREFVRRMAKLLQPPTLNRTTAYLTDLMQITWQGKDIYSPLASRDTEAKTYAEELIKGVRSHVHTLCRESMLPSIVKTHLDTTAQQLRINATKDVEIIENSMIGGVWPAFYLRLSPKPAARVVAAIAFLQIECAVWGGGQGDPPCTWNTSDFDTRMDEFVERHGGDWTRSLTSIRDHEETAGFKEKPYDLLSDKVLALIESMT